MSYLSIKHVDKVYPNGFCAVKDFNLEVDEHDFVVIVGPSGCGKSTMLRMISGLESITDGEMILEGKKINECSPKERDIAMVFQNYALYPHLSVYDNIGFSLLVRKKNRRLIHEKVMNASKIVEIDDGQLKRKPGQLSGGQRQRVALGRTIAREAKLFLMDEPLSNLDAKLRGDMRVEIIELWRKYNQTIIYVSHDQVEAMTMATKIVLMNNGVIEQVGAPNYIYNHPETLFAATFLGTPQINLIDGRLEDGRYINQFFSLELPGYKGITNSEVILGIRSENLSIVKENEDFTAVIDYVEYLGAKSIVHTFLGETKIAVNTKESIAGLEKCRIKINLYKIILFDKKTSKSIRGDQS
ncbi:MAG: ATP-binding cassette domain-containing protein [Anaeroplasmataceae bacterium]|nr:ATP-binding cassette domain-containing protein [Anaeroplasmataceae bacterium]